MEELAKQVQQKIGLNDEIISSLKEFFGTTLSDFLKVYRDFENAEDEKLKNILKRQDTIYQKLHELMKASSLRFANSKEDSLSKLTEINGRQQRFISSIREFFYPTLNLWQHTEKNRLNCIFRWKHCWTSKR